MKVLLVTFSDNADHQDIAFGMYESIYELKDPHYDVWLMGIKTPKVSVLDTPHTHLVDCPKKPGVEKKTFDFSELYSIISWINTEKFNVIFFETLHIWNLPIMLLCHKNVRIFQMIHDPIPHTGDKQSGKVHLMNKVVCKMADHIVLANKLFVPTVINTYKINLQKISSIDMWRRFPEYVEPSYSKRALFFGRLNPYKGIDNLLEIARLCPDVQFDIVGRVDPQVQGIVNELKELSNVSVKTAYVSDAEMTEAFKKADWVLLPYNSASQSGVIIDGYRYGKPCIAFKVGAIIEQVRDGKSGFLIEPGNNLAFAQKLDELVHLSKHSYKELSRTAYQFGYQKYAVKEAVERFLQLIS